MSDEQKSFRLMNAKEFAEATGFPLGRVRRLCRSGAIPHWKMGRRYLLDYNEALKAMKLCQEKPQDVSVTPYLRRWASFGCGTGQKRSFKERLKEL